VETVPRVLENSFVFEDKLGSEEAGDRLEFSWKPLHQRAEEPLYVDTLGWELASATLLNAR
jgi:hypothetical protein